MGGVRLRLSQVRGCPAEAIVPSATNQKPSGTRGASLGSSEAWRLGDPGGGGQWGQSYGLGVPAQ